MVGRVGDDPAGRSLVAGMVSEGIDVSAIGTDLGAATGLAVITLDDTAENAIVVSPGANANLSIADIDAAAGLIASAPLLLMQLEVPLDVVVRAADLANGIVVLNPAPARSLPGHLLERADVLIPNRSELSVLAGGAELSDLEKVVAAARSLTVATVIVTLGSQGSVGVSGDRTCAVEAPSVDAVDTVGAGDAFCAAVADAFARGAGLREAMEWATDAAALAVTRHGAQAAMPSRGEVLAFRSGG